MLIGPGSSFRSSIHIVVPSQSAPFTCWSIDIAVLSFPGPLAMFVSPFSIAKLPHQIHIFERLDTSDENSRRIKSKRVGHITMQRYSRVIVREQRHSVGFFCCHRRLKLFSALRNQQTQNPFIHSNT